MDVTICNNNGRIEIQFRKWKENRGRLARIELDILRALTYMVVDPTADDGNTFKIFREPNSFLGNFTRQDLDKIIRVLKGYCIQPKVEL